MAYIYKISNSVNDKVYVGKTTVSIMSRWRQHKCAASCKENKCKSKLYSAMRKYGKEKFYIDIIEECENDCADERERYWIEQLDSVRNGYNITTGGDGHGVIDVYDEREILALWKDGKMQNEINKITGVSVKVVKRILYKSGVTRDEIISRQSNYFRKIYGKPVYSYDLNGAFISAYKSIQEASIDTGVHPSTIGHIINGRDESSNGFTFRDYKKDNIEFVRTVFPKAKRVFRYDLNGVYIDEFPSFLSAATSVGLKDAHSIAKSCNNHKTICAGYQWRYFKADKIDAADLSDGRHLSRKNTNMR